MGLGAYSVQRKGRGSPRGSLQRDAPIRSPRPSRGASGESDFLSLGTHVSVEVPLPLMAVAFPILPGKTPEWRAWIDEINGPRHDEFAASRRNVGLHERTFLQQTPMGDLVIVTLEGDDPAASFGRLMTGTDEFSKWFGERAASVHGFDLSQMPAGSPSELVVDSEAAAVPA